MKEERIHERVRSLIPWMNKCQVNEWMIQKQDPSIQTSLVTPSYPSPSVLSCFRFFAEKEISDHELQERCRRRREAALEITIIWVSWWWWSSSQESCCFPWKRVRASKRPRLLLHWRDERKERERREKGEGIAISLVSILFAVEKKKRLLVQTKYSNSFGIENRRNTTQLTEQDTRKKHQEDDHHQEGKQPKWTHLCLLSFLFSLLLCILS